MSDSWPPRETTLTKLALPVLAAGSVALAGFLWDAHSRLSVLEARLSRQERDLAAMEIKLESSVAGRHQDIRNIQKSLNDIRVTVGRIEERVNGGRHRRGD